jgi:hypothetical protein
VLTAPADHTERVVAVGAHVDDLAVAHTGFDPAPGWTNPANPFFPLYVAHCGPGFDSYKSNAIGIIAYKYKSLRAVVWVVLIRLAALDFWYALISAARDYKCAIQKILFYFS